MSDEPRPPIGSIGWCDLTVPAGQTGIQDIDSEDEFTKVLIDASSTKDESDASGHASPVEAVRQ